MDNLSQIFLTFFSAIIMVAIVSVIVSRRSQAGSVIQDFGTSLSKVVGAAVQPVVAPKAGDGVQTGMSAPLTSFSLPPLF